MGSLGPDHHREWTEKATPASAMSAAGGMKAGRDRARLRPCSKAKIDELFVAWLSIGKTQELIASLVEDAHLGRPLRSREAHSEDGSASPSKQRSFKALGSPPLSPSKVRNTNLHFSSSSSILFPDLNLT